VTLIEVSASDGQTAFIVPRAITRVRPGLSGAGAAGQTRIELGAAHYHTQASIKEVIELLRDTDVSLMHLVDPDGFDIYVNVSLVASVEDRTPRDRREAHAAVWISGQRQSVRQSVGELKNSLSGIP